jgi:glycolate oxidase
MLIAAPKVPRPPASAIDRAKLALEQRVGASRVITDPNGCATYGEDESEVAAVTPDMVVLAESADHVAATLAVAAEHRIPVTPRAGGTGRTGGAVPVAGGIVLATASLARVKEVNRDDMLVVVEPGVVTGELHALVEREGLFYPPDPNSLEHCMIGGNVAENAGGPRALKYGVTREYVLGLEVALMGGTRLRTGRRTVKGVTGYDMTALFVGSEGTLGVFTEITLRLVSKPAEIATVLALFSDARAAGQAVTDVLRAGLVPRCLELMDARTLGAVRAQGVAIDERAGALLLAEVDGDSALVEAQVARLGETLSGAKGLVALQAAQDAAQRGRLWATRRALSPATKRMAKHKLSEDVVVPRSRIPELLERVDAISAATGVRALTYGHAGDGNLHVNFLWDDDAERPAVDDALHRLMKDTVAVGGTLTGEHGIGVTKAAYLPLEQSSELIAVQQGLKRTFDPHELLNPGKIFPVR